MTNVLGNRALNEVKAGFAGFYYATLNYTTWPGHPQATSITTHGSPRITFSGFGILGNDSSPQKSSTNAYSIRDDFSHSLTAAGRHDLKIGGEYIYQVTGSSNCRSCMGLIDAQGGPVPANIEALFPVWDDASTWNLAALNSITRRYQIGVGNFRLAFDEHNIAGWVQDDWAVTQRLTLNLGVRYDLGLGSMGERSGGPAIPRSRSSQRHEQRGPAIRICVQPQRPNRDARRSRALLRRARAEPRVPHDRPGQHCHPGIAARRSARLRRQPVQRSDPDVRAGPPAVLFGQGRPGVSAARDGRRQHRPASGIREAAKQLSDPPSACSASWATPRWWRAITSSSVAVASAPRRGTSI